MNTLHNIQYIVADILSKRVVFEASCKKCPHLWKIILTYFMCCRGISHIYSKFQLLSTNRSNFIGNYAKKWFSCMYHYFWLHSGIKLMDFLNFSPLYAINTILTYLKDNFFHSVPNDSWYVYLSEYVSMDLGHLCSQKLTWTWNYDHKSTIFVQF